MALEHIMVRSDQARFAKNRIERKVFDAGAEIPSCEESPLSTQVLLTVALVIVLSS